MMTIKDIADQLGISKSTVSRVLNGYTDNFSVSAEMRARIMDLVDSSGYRINPVFSSLRQKNNRQIAFLFAERSILKAGSVVESSLTRLGEALENAGYEFNYSFCRLRPDGRYPLPPWKVAGVILPDILRSDELDVIEESALPYVALNGVCGENGSSVRSDDKCNMRIVLDHLYDLGHRRIGYLNFSVDNTPSRRRSHYSALEREEAYREYIAERQLPVLDGCEVSSASEEERIDLLLRQNVSAIITFNAKLGIAALHAAWRRKIRVPEELSLITFNDLWMLNYTTPPLSCLDIPAAAMGEKAAEILIGRLTAPDVPFEREVRLPGKLLMRESTASAANRKSGI